MLGLIPAPWRPWAMVAACLALVGLGWWLGSRSEASDHAQTKAEHAQVLQRIAEQARDVAEKTRQAEADIRIQEHQMAEEVAAIATAYEDERNAIETNTRAAVLADLRAGRVRLRNDTATRCAVPDTAQAPAAAGRSDGQAVDGDEAARVAADAIGIGAEADAQLAACQSVIRAYASASAEGAGKP